MKKTAFQKQLLTQAVLASTLFVATATHAALIISDEVNVTQATSAPAANGVIQITSLGSIKVNDLIGAEIDSIGGKIIIDKNNINGVNGIDAIQTTGIAAIAGVEFQSSDGTLTIGKGSGVDNKNTNANTTAVSILAANGSVINAGMIVNQGIGSRSAIEINGDNSVINNTGSVVNANAKYAIELLVNGTDATINNEQDGIIFNSNVAAGETILANATGLTLNNSGNIQQNAQFDGILLNQAFSSITNNDGAFIKQTGGNAKAVIHVSGGGTGNLTNNQNATIVATQITTRGIEFDTNGYDGVLTNAGTILTENSAGLALGVNFSQTITNDLTGSISRNLVGEGTVRSIVGVNLGGGFVNKGNITGIGGGGAIDFITQASAVTLFQESGIINGDVHLAFEGSNGSGPVLVMDGGKILGNVTAANILPNLLELNGGEIAGTVQLGSQGDQVDLTGTDIQGLLLGGAGNDTINVSGGNFLLLNGQGGINTLNVTKSFTPNGPIAFMSKISVQNPGTVLTLNNPVTDMNNFGLFIDPDTTVELNTSIQGSGGIENSGTFGVLSDSLVDLSTGPSLLLNLSPGTMNLRDNILTLNSNTSQAFINYPGATLKVDLVGITSPNALTTNGALNILSTQTNAAELASDSIIAPSISGFIPEGQRFDIMNVIGGGTIDPVLTKLVQPASAFISFTEQFNNGDTILSLIAHRNSFQSFSGSEVTEGIANALEQIALGDGLGSPVLLNLITQFQGLTSAAEIELAMQSLLPPFNYGLVAGSHLGMDIMFDSVIKRLSDKVGRRSQVAVASVAPTTATQADSTTKGTNFGDFTTFAGGLWGEVLGGHLTQSQRHGLPGYRAKGAGLAIGGDWAANDCTLFGLAASYTKVNVDDKNTNPKDQSIKSWQGTAYGWWEFMDGLYLDALFGVASNHYKTNRVIHVNEIHTGAHGDFDGTQYGAQADLGWDLIRCDNSYFAPFLRLKYVHLDLDDYTEEGELGLHVENHNVKEFLGGIGFRAGTGFTCGSIQYVPELSAMIAYDFENNGEQTFGGFIAGGPAFGTNGIKPGRTIFDLGVGVNTYLSCNSIVGIKYNLELRSQFVGNSLYLQYNYLWS